MPQSNDSKSATTNDSPIDSSSVTVTVTADDDIASTTNLKNVPMSPKVKAYRYMALIGHLGLLAWMSIWYLGLSGARDYSITFIFIVYLLPLLFPLYGIVKAKPYTHAWSCFVVLWYFMHSATTMYVEPTYIIHAVIEMVFVIMMFVGCAMFARLRGQELGTGLPKLSKVMEQEKELFEGK
ncbi:MAG: putative membrane protein [Alphaproteobacteria bacterium]|jgi:uncharacterized membrane protein